jgi:hypothetical protein
MIMLRIDSLIVALGIYVFALGFNATAAIESPVVKKSSSGICHDSSSQSFKLIKNFTPNESIIR